MEDGKPITGYSGEKENTMSGFVITDITWDTPNQALARSLPTKIMVLGCQNRDQIDDVVKTRIGIGMDMFHAYDALEWLTDHPVTQATVIAR